MDTIIFEFVDLVMEVPRFDSIFYKKFVRADIRFRPLGTRPPGKIGLYSRRDAMIDQGGVWARHQPSIGWIFKKGIQRPVVLLEQFRQLHQQGVG